MQSWQWHSHKLGAANPPLNADSAVSISSADNHVSTVFLHSVCAYSQCLRLAHCLCVSLSHVWACVRCGGDWLTARAHDQCARLTHCLTVSAFRSLVLARVCAAAVAAAQVRKMKMISPTNREVDIGRTLKDNEYIGMVSTSSPPCSILASYIVSVYY
jgi:hypothetical protein